jgi:hypothetical protein
MAGPHDDLLTAAEHEAAQLLVTLHGGLTAVS